MLSRNNVLSIKKHKSCNTQDFIKKLNKRKIKWIGRETNKRDMGAWSISKQQNITPRHVRGVYKKYKNIKDPVLRKPERKPKK